MYSDSLSKSDILNKQFQSVFTKKSTTANNFQKSLNFNYMVVVSQRLNSLLFNLHDVIHDYGIFTVIMIQHY